MNFLWRMARRGSPAGPFSSGWTGATARSCGSVDVDQAAYLLGVQRNARSDAGRKYTPPKLKIVETASEGNTAVPPDELFREGARRMLVEALEVEVSE